MHVEYYRDYEITIEYGGYCVVFCGDEVIHESIEAARAFIDEIHQNENDPDWWNG